MKAVVVLSGGQDSATCLALAVKKYGASEVAAITFRYGQRHQLETKYARALAKRFGITEHKVISLDFYKHLTTNALMSNDIKIEKKKGAKCPTTVVEGRNAFFLQAAAVWARKSSTRGFPKRITRAILTVVRFSSKPRRRRFVWLCSGRFEL